MKICVPTETDSGSDSRLCDHFGRAPFLATADTETGQVEVRPNAGCQDGHGNLVGRLTATGVEAVVCRGLGRRVLTAMHDAGLRVLFTTEQTVSEVVDAVRGGRLVSIPDEKVCCGGQHGHGGHGGQGGHGGCGGHH